MMQYQIMAYIKTLIVPFMMRKLAELDFFTTIRLAIFISLEK